VTLATQTPVSTNPQLGLTNEARHGVIEILQTTLADEMVLYTRLRNYHWNVTGPQFQSLHELFEKQYTQLAETIDETAERIRAYGAYAKGTMTEFVQMSRLEERPNNYPTAQEMIRELAEDNEMLVRALREDIDTVDDNYDDVGAEDFLTALLQDHQEMAWMLRTFISGPAVHD